jgi:hypothetical protein
LTVHKCYTDEEWRRIADVVASAGATLSEDEARSLRSMVDSAAHYFSWERPGTQKKRADQVIARLGSARRRIEKLGMTELGSGAAMKLATEIERDLTWVVKVDAYFVSRVDRVMRARNIAGWLFILDRELMELEEDYPSWADHREEYPSSSPLHQWLLTLADLWERSGLNVKSSGHFPAFVMAARTRGIKRDQLTPTTVRDFVLREWRCRTSESQ